MSSPRSAPAAQASIDSLDPDTLSLIASYLKYFLNPFFDRGDLLMMACCLAQVGNASFTELAGAVFRFLSPRLGQALPVGVTSSSSSSIELKASLKGWGLSITGNKQVLWQRLVEQVEDSVEGPTGSAPRWCLVSGATRSELAGCSQARISHSRAHEVFKLTKLDLSGLPFLLLPTQPHPTKSLLLRDVKAKAAQKHGSWERLCARRERLAVMLQEVRVEWQEKRGQRLDSLRAELLGRGVQAGKVQSELMCNDNPALSTVLFGSNENTPIAAAVDYLLRMHFLMQGPAGVHYYMACMTDTWEPPKSLAKYKAAEQRRERAAAEALRCWVAAQPSVESIRAHTAVPPSFLPELERAWGQLTRGDATQPAAGGL